MGTSAYDPSQQPVILVRMSVNCDGASLAQRAKEKQEAAIAPRNLKQEAAIYMTWVHLIDV
jgi:hypothetical protein